MTLPTSTVTDLSNFLPEILDLPREAEKHTLFLKDKMQEDRRVLNRKETACYYLVEQPTSQIFFGANPQTTRFAYRKVFNFGAIATDETLNITHNIVGFTIFTRIYGTVITSIPDYRPLPFADTLNVTNQIRLNTTAVDIVITNGATAPNITQGIVVVEYLKS